MAGQAPVNSVCIDMCNLICFQNIVILTNVMHPPCKTEPLACGVLQDAPGGMYVNDIGLALMSSTFKV